MLHLVAAPAPIAHRHQIEAVLVPGAPMAQPPAQRHSLDRPALERIDPRLMEAARDLYASLKARVNGVLVTAVPGRIDRALDVLD